MQRHSWRISPFPAGTSGPRPARRCRLAGRLDAACVLLVLFVALMAALLLWRPLALETALEDRLVDWRFRARERHVHFRSGNPRAPRGPSRTVIVLLDGGGEGSLDLYGERRWPAYRLARLIEAVAAGRPRALGIDLPLHESDPGWTESWLAEAFAAAPGKTASALRLRLAVAPAATTGPPPPGAITRLDDPDRLLAPAAADPLLPPDRIAKATTFGHTVRQADGDGRLRRETLYLRLGDALVPSLALQTARIAAGLPPGGLRVLDGGGIDLAGTVVPADRRGRLLVNYYDDNDGEGAFPRYAAASVLSGGTDPAVFEDAVVFIAAAGAVADLVDTPVATGVPAVEKDATVAANILAADFLREAPVAANLGVLLAAGLAVPLLLRRRAVLSLLCLVGAALALVGANFALFVHGWLLALGYPLLALLLAGGTAVVGQHLGEVRVARRMRRLFSSYVTDRVLERLIADPAMARPGGERRDVTILFMDIRGFTSFSEKHPPEEVVRTLNEYLEAMTEVIFRWEGTLDKFIGDTILAFWGAPLPQEDHAERALRCAGRLCARLDELNAAWGAAGRQPLEIGIGVTTGQVLVGNVGAEGKKMDYTVIGDQVNLCSRVEELTKDFHARILITANTFARVEHLVAAGALPEFSFEELAEVAVKGKEEPVRLYRVAPRGTAAAARVTEPGGGPPVSAATPATAPKPRG